MKIPSYATAGFVDRDLNAALEAIARANFSQAEILGQEPHLETPLYGHALHDFQKHLKSLGLSTTVHAPLTRNVIGAPEESWRQEKVKVFSDYLHFAAAIEATYLVVHPVPNPIFLDNPNDPTLPDRMRDAARRSLDDLCPICQKTGVRILLENLPYNCDYPLQTMHQLRPLVAPYPDTCIGLVVDTGHAAVLGNDPAEEIRIAGDRLFGTHLQDIDTAADPRQDDHWIPTHGTLNWDEIRAALNQIDYVGPWTFETGKSRHNETPEEVASTCRQIATEWGL